ncbi:hypothetical protein HIM_08419 [Hirsutella minnesotensis 3608]|uniref:Rhodopsin domain-containing protein n=1 Tax=Hirsutella minnesotensis 3608 TaxID=1043627 RepID=A0A0F8A3N8_9HYPO|nr:hypothetical protein HIM_08419 [Hirsutella minnesotensis 3608]
MVRIGGLGRHMAYWYKHDPATLTTYLKIQTACEFVYMVGITFPKISILLLYLSIFVSRPTRIVTWIVLGIVVNHWIVTGVIATFTICQPFAYKWDKTIPGGRCTNLMAAYKYVSIPNIATDLAILVLPASSLLKLQTSKARKVGIFITFLTGSL